MQLLFHSSSVGGQQHLKLRRMRACQYLHQLSKISTGHVNHPGNYISRTELLTARFFDTFYIQCTVY